MYTDDYIECIYTNFIFLSPVFKTQSKRRQSAAGRGYANGASDLLLHKTADHGLGSSPSTSRRRMKRSSSRFCIPSIQNASALASGSDSDSRQQ
jgi:hypothetical protein